MLFRSLPLEREGQQIVQPALCRVPWCLAAHEEGSDACSIHREHPAFEPNRHKKGVPREDKKQGIVPNTGGEDRVQTPLALAQAIAKAFQPSGTILEPCAGTGNFVRALRPYGSVVSCEIDRGDDFFTWTGRVDWIVTNPPWSQYRRFLAHALEVADRVAFVSTLNHLWTRSRRELVRRAGFGLEKIIEFDAPKEWPSTGFQLGMVLLIRGYQGACVVENLTDV